MTDLLTRGWYRQISETVADLEFLVSDGEMFDQKSVVGETNHKGHHLITSNTKDSSENLRVSTWLIRKGALISPSVIKLAMDSKVAGISVKGAEERIFTLAKKISENAPDSKDDPGWLELQPREVLGFGGGNHPPLLEINDVWAPSHTELLSIKSVFLNGDQEPDLDLPFNSLLNENRPLGTLARHFFLEFESKKIRANVDEYGTGDLHVVAVTTHRKRSVWELAKSIRKWLGRAVPITVVVQAPKGPVWKLVSMVWDVELIHVDSDYGLAASRNLAISSVDRRLIWLMDDDFQIDSRARVSSALKILSSFPEIVVLGGNLLDVNQWKESVQKEKSQGFAMKMLSFGDSLRWLRLEDAPRERYFTEPTTYFEECDIVDNFAIFKRAEVFETGLIWNPELKIGAEHQDLYLSMMKMGIGKVARTNALKVRNVRAQDSRFRRMRGRQNFFLKFFQDQGLNSFEISGGLRRQLTFENDQAMFQNQVFFPRIIRDQ